MALFKKKEKCIHHWHYIGKKTVSPHSGLKDKDKVNALFCPKCEKEAVANDERWTQLQAIQKIRESYQKTTNTEKTITQEKTIAPTNTVRKGRLHQHEAR